MLQMIKLGPMHIFQYKWPILWSKFPQHDQNFENTENLKVFFTILGRFL